MYLWAMEFRNLKRFVLTPKALAKHNKKATFELTQKRLATLYIIHTMQQTGCKTSIRSIQTHLKNVNRNDDWLNLLRTINAMQEANLLEKIGSQYKVTIQGFLLLQDLETKLRKERLDR